jgi:hypothetical protein
MSREMRGNRDPALGVETRVRGVLHELQVIAALLGIDARLLPLEAFQDLLPLRERVEEQRSPEAARGDELPARLAVAKPCRQVGAPLLIDRMRELTQIRRSDPVS